MISYRFSPLGLFFSLAKKMPIYAESGAPYLWMIDLLSQAFEAFMLESDKWVQVAIHAENEKIRAKPFQEIELDPSLLWA